MQDLQLFWEQALLKLILEKKTKELVKDTQITETEIEDYYRNNIEPNYPDKSLAQYKEQIRRILLRGKQDQVILSWTENLKKNANIEIQYKELDIKER